MIPSKDVLRAVAPLLVVALAAGIFLYLRATKPETAAKPPEERVYTVAAVTAGGAGAQELARRVANVGDGTVRVAFPARPEVEICDQGVRWGSHRMWWHSRSGEEAATGCRRGPVEVELRVREGRVRDVDVIRDPDETTAGAVELGAVSAESAVAYFLELGRDGAAGGRADVLFPAVLADEAARERFCDQCHY